MEHLSISTLKSEANIQIPFPTLFEGISISRYASQHQQHQKWRRACLPCFHIHLIPTVLNRECRRLCTKCSSGRCGILRFRSSQELGYAGESSTCQQMGNTACFISGSCTRRVSFRVNRAVMGHPSLPLPLYESVAC